MNITTNWQPDPFGIHELRFFSADGKPTQLVMDGEVTSYDKPPQVELPADLRRQSEAPEPTIVEPVPGPASASLSPAVPPNPVPPVADPGESETSVFSERPPAVSLQRSDTALGARPVQGQPEDRQVQRQLVSHEADTRDVVAVEHREVMPPLGRPLTIAYGIVLGLLALSALGLLYVHVLKPKDGSAQTGAVTTSTAPARHATTTTVALPTTPQPSADAAASALVSNWSTGNRAAALKVAMPAAVATLFGAPYTAGLAIDRGCSTAFSPIVCTFGAPAGASPNDAIYEILTSQGPGGWYVSSVKIEH